MTEAEPTAPFRRFPWIQLVFCLACISMAAWTWMRYSYVWAVAPEDFWVDPDGLPLRRNDSLVGNYVCLRGELKSLHEDGRRDRQPTDGVTALVAGRRGVCLPGWVYPADRLLLPRDIDTEVSITGRVVDGEEGRWAELDPTRSRYHGASIAGLAVGAMGCFIFGLYLRRWLRERKALASEPERDMIA